MKYLKLSGKLCVLLCGSLLAGLLLLWCAFLLPEGSIMNHAVSSAETFSYEGIDAAVGYAYSERLDNWTDALMIGNACYQKEGAGALERAAAAYRPDYRGENPIASLEAYMKSQDGVGAIPYPRYWHGYLVVLRPLLMVTDYMGIRTMNTIAFAVVLLVLIGVILRKKQWELLLPLGATILFLRPLSVVHSLQFSTVFYPMMLSVIACIVFQKWVLRDEHFVYLIFMNGVWIGYLDLLTYPAASLGVLLTVLMMLQKHVKVAERIRQLVLSSAAWGFGYFGMWGGKWFISSAILHQNVLSDALSQAQVRVSGSYGEHHFSRVMVFARNLGAGFIGVLVPAAIFFVLLTVFMLWRRRECLKTREGWMAVTSRAIPYLLICLIPFVWYSIFTNHSYIHIIFTYRTLAAAVCAWCGMCVMQVES